MSTVLFIRVSRPSVGGGEVVRARPLHHGRIVIGDSHEAYKVLRRRRFVVLLKLQPELTEAMADGVFNSKL